MSSPLAYACKVSATLLQIPTPPTSLSQHASLLPLDQHIWDSAYAEEYFGLQSDTKTWEYITEGDYQCLLPVIGCALPSFVLATIKYDEH
eukprot:13943497-Ditylum_brightwellii.AAC.1